MAFDLMTPPTWAPTWCYFYLAGALIVVGMVFFALIVGFKKMNSMAILAFVTVGVLNFINAMMYFWMCRGALAK